MAFLNGRRSLKIPEPAYGSVHPPDSVRFSSQLPGFHARGGWAGCVTLAWRYCDKSETTGAGGKFYWTTPAEPRVRFARGLIKPLSVCFKLQINWRLFSPFCWGKWVTPQPFARAGKQERRRGCGYLADLVITFP